MMICDESGGGQGCIFSWTDWNIIGIVPCLCIQVLDPFDWTQREWLNPLNKSSTEKDKSKLFTRDSAFSHLSNKQAGSEIWRKTTPFCSSFNLHSVKWINQNQVPGKKVGIRVGAWYFAIENIPLQKSYH